VEQPLIEYIVGQAGMAGVAVLALWMLNAVWKMRVEDEQDRREQETRDRKRMEVIVEENTKAITSMTETMRRVCEFLPQTSDGRWASER